jgi:PKD repeat protein
VDASGSSDADGSISAYEWSFDGTAKTGQTQTHTFDAAGDYDVTLTVTDDDGSSDSTTQTITVTEPPLPNSVVFDGSADSETTDYLLTVSGEVETDDSAENLETGDTATDGTISGSVTDDLDSYRFSGDVVDLSVTGTARIVLVQQE